MRNDEVVVSLVLATKERTKEIGRFLGSISVQEGVNGGLEVIVVDQNVDDRLSGIVAEYRSKVTIVHLRSFARGLSEARNAGLQVAKGRFVGFPDDDCFYYPDTVQCVLSAFARDIAVGGICGKVSDRGKGQDLIRKWPVNEQRIGSYNSYRYGLSIIMFFRKGETRFDEQLGAGKEFGACEDSDFLLRIIKAGVVVLYDPSVEVWHADNRLCDFSEEKITKYGMGFGAFSRKHFSVLTICVFVAGTTAQLFRAMGARLSGDKILARRYYSSFVARLMGFKEYKRS